MKSRLVVLAALAVIVAIAAIAGRSSSCAPKGGDGIAPSDGGNVVTSPEVRAKLRDATRAKGPAYVARTRHKEPDGSPTYVNRLVLETSPYLLQHAHNPVDWFPWGEEAFDKARLLGRPILLSVGYSTCHWCHVMEEESFEDEEVARAINEGYVAIKVDREERPDIDAIYMRASQTLTGGGGGWPMTVWLTSDKQPFHAGTYFPARTFLPLLRKLASAYAADKSGINAEAQRLAEVLQQQLAPQTSGTVPTAATLDSATNEYRARFDSENGGMRGRPKFPSSLPVRFLLRDERRNPGRRPSPVTDSLTMATQTLEHMSRGGMYDQLGGGFHRYSTDDRWLVPHFEKMLYDNALLVVAYLEGYQTTRREEFAAVAKDILAYVERDMTSPEDAFFSATDADSLDPSGRREEGWFFTWTQAELDAVLGVQNARIVGDYYGVTAQGHVEGRSVLSISSSRRATDPTRKIVSDARAPLLAARAKRPPPLRDEKILTSWNALMITAHARAALAIGGAESAPYAARAERAADFILSKLVREDRLLRTYRDGKAKLDAYLDDYAFFIAALLDLYEATGRQRWLEEAIRLDGILERHYEDKHSGCYFATSDDHEKLLAREKPSYDGAEPSGSSIVTLDLLRLHELTTRDSYRTRAEGCLAMAAKVLASSPVSLSEMLIAVDFAVDVPKEIVIVTPRDRAEAEPFLAKLRETFLPNKVLVVVPEGEALTNLEKLVPLVASKVAQHGKTTAYVCEKRSCALPTSNPEVFGAQLRVRATAPSR